MLIRMLLVLLLLASCSPSPDYQVSRTVQISGERLAEIRRNPHVKRYERERAPAARLTGLDRDPWPAGIVFMGVMDPYLEELGLGDGMLLTAINGKQVHDIFLSRWQYKRLRRPAGFDYAHYRDIVEYLFLENQWNEFVVTVLRDVPSSIEALPQYVAKVEHWRIKLK